MREKIQSKCTNINSLTQLFLTTTNGCARRMKKKTLMRKCKHIHITLRTLHLDGNVNGNCNLSTIKLLHEDFTRMNKFSKRFILLTLPIRLVFVVAFQITEKIGQRKRIKKKCTGIVFSHPYYRIRFSYHL